MDGIYSCYENVASAGFVVFINSTLGYEALARGKKATAFTLRGEFLGPAAGNFGSVADLPEKGPFWTSHWDEREFKRVMDYEQSILCRLMFP